MLEGIDIFKDFLVVSERKNGLNQIKIDRWDGSDSYYLPFESETYTAYTSTNVDFDTALLRYGYQYMTNPSSVIDFNMVTKEKTIKQDQEVLGGKFKKEHYVSERICATETYGTQIPISLVRHTATPKNAESTLT